MSHPNPQYDPENSLKHDSPFGKALKRKKMSPVVHNSKEFKETRKAFQGINSTKAGAISKSLRRHSDKNKNPY